jgi:AAA domain
VFALVLTGPPGVGKTAVLTALENALADDKIRHAVVEVEALSWAHPPLSDTESLLHLATFRELYVARGYDLLLCGATITSPGYMHELIAALSADKQLVVRLEADPSVLRQRIIEREPPSWSGLPSLLDATEKIVKVGNLLPHVDAVFSTVNVSPVQIAEQIRSMSPDVLLLPGAQKVGTSEDR